MDEDGWWRFIRLCLKAKTPEKLSDLFHVFLTPEERADLSKRILIVQELLKGEKTQREMAKDLEVSIAKITRGSNELKGIDEKLKQFLKRSL
ncbi:trp operon repressor [Simkania sp.]|uniref:trp operon repressor n=1 Tax=Simkania sp. TaxID=34094 RepID=UPI003B523076